MNLRNLTLRAGANLMSASARPRVPKSRVNVRLRCVGKVLRGDPSAYAASLERYEFFREP